jgi:hypothetical protein
MMHEAFTKPGAAAGGGCWVDVRDLALAHVRALQKEEAGGERIIITAGAFAWQDWRACFSSSFLLFISPFLSSAPRIGFSNFQSCLFLVARSILLTLERSGRRPFVLEIPKGHARRGEGRRAPAALQKREEHPRSGDRVPQHGGHGGRDDRGL